MPLLGAHVSASGGLDRAVARAVEIGAESMQIFTSSPRQWAARSLTDGEIGAFRRALLESGISAVVSHASYLINIAGVGDMRSRSERALIGEIERCDALGIDEIVLHPGSGGEDREEGKRRAASLLSNVMRSTRGARVRILLETMAGGGTILGTSVRELADIIEMLEWDDRLGVCVDICHVFGAGVDLRTAGGYDRLVENLREQVGLSRVGCWHMSDSRAALGSNIDRHEHIGDGEIGTTPFAMLASDERFAGVPAVLETPKDGVGDAGNLALLRKICGRG